MASIKSVKTVGDLMRLWPTISDYARDVGLRPTHAQTIAVRGRLPVEYWDITIKAAARRSIDGVTADFILKLHSETPEKKRA